MDYGLICSQYLVRYTLQGADMKNQIWCLQNCNCCMFRLAPQPFKILRVSATSRATAKRKEAMRIVLEQWLWWWTCKCGPLTNILYSQALRKWESSGDIYAIHWVREPYLQHNDEKLLYHIRCPSLLEAHVLLTRVSHVVIRKPTRYINIQVLIPYSLPSRHLKWTACSINECPHVLVIAVYFWQLLVGYSGIRFNRVLQFYR